MDNLEALEALGLAEVSRKTHIDTKFLKYIIHKDFEKLNRANTRGFIKILQREYDLDLSYWLDEFEEYWQQNGVEVFKSSQQNLISENTAPSGSFKKYIFLILFLAILGGIGFFVKQTFFPNLTNETFSSLTQEQEQILEEANEILNAVDESSIEFKDDVKIEPIKDDNNFSTSNFTEIKSSQNQVLSAINDELAKEIKEEIAQSLESEKNEDETIKKNQEENKDQIVDTNTSEAVIRPNKKIWFGTVNLQTRKRTSNSSSDEIKIDLSKPQIIITGHGDFEMTLNNDEKIKPSTKRTLYYYVNNGTISEISKEEFKVYNGGKSW